LGRTLPFLRAITIQDVYISSVYVESVFRFFRDLLYNPKLFEIL